MFLRSRSFLFLLQFLLSSASSLLPPEDSFYPSLIQPAAGSKSLPPPEDKGIRGDDANPDTLQKYNTTGVEDNFKESASMKENYIVTCGFKKLPRKKRQTWYSPQYEFKWNHHRVTYAIVQYSRHLSQQRTKGIIKRAFDVWASVTPLSFTQVDPGQSHDISIGFYSSYEHDNVIDPGSPYGSAAAHAMFPSTQGSYVHFNDDLNWSDQFGYGTTELLPIAVHEFGHSIGLAHDCSDSMSTMCYPAKSTLSQRDISRAQNLYGVKRTQGNEVDNTGHGSGRTGGSGGSRDWPNHCNTGNGFRNCGQENWYGVKRTRGSEVDNTGFGSGRTGGSGGSRYWPDNVNTVYGLGNPPSNLGNRRPGSDSRFSNSWIKRYFTNLFPGRRYQRRY